jgi:MSHA pilin protein MshC
VELVATLIVIGILAAVVLPNLAGTQVYDQLSFSDRTLSLLQYAQKSAVAKRRLVCVTFTATSLTLMYASTFTGACDTPLLDPAPPSSAAASNVFIAPGNATYAALPAAFNFGSDGSATVPQTINVSGARNIIIEATGYVHYP